jgi:hypothetical protein
MLFDKTVTLVNRVGIGVQKMKKNAALSFPAPLFIISMRNISLY